MITAFVRKERENAVSDDNFEIVLEYDCGLKVNLGSSMMARIPGPRYKITGTSGCFLKYGYDPQEAALKEGKLPGFTETWGKEDPSNWGEIDADVDGININGRIKSETGSYGKFYENVRDSILENKLPEINPVDAAKVVKIIELSFLSSREKRAMKFEFREV